MKHREEIPPNYVIAESDSGFVAIADQWRSTVCEKRHLVIVETYCLVVVVVNGSKRSTTLETQDSIRMCMGVGRPRKVLDLLLADDALHDDVVVFTHDGKGEAPTEVGACLWRRRFRNRVQPFAHTASTCVAQVVFVSTLASPTGKLAWVQPLQLPGVEVGSLVFSSCG